MLVARYKTKKAARESIGEPFRFEETSMFGNEYRDGIAMTYTVVGPGAYDRKWYANITVDVDGNVARVR